MEHTRTNLPDGQVEFTVELGKAELEQYLVETEQRLASNLRLDGFRTGKVPRALVRQQIGEAALKQQALELAIQSSFGNILREEKLEVIQQEGLTVQANTPERLVYKIVLSVFPALELKHYTDLTIEKQPVSISDQEVDATLAELRRLRAGSDGVEPVLDDSFAQTVGHFQTLVELKTNLRQGLVLEKEAREKDRRRLAILAAIVERNKITAPNRLVEQRLDETLTEFDATLHQQGKELGLYLAETKQTQTQLREQWRDKATQQVKFSLVARAVARQAQIQVSAEEVAVELAVLVDHYTQRGMIEQLKQTDSSVLSGRIRAVLLNEKVFQWLEDHN